MAVAAELSSICHLCRFIGDGAVPFLLYYLLLEQQFVVSESVHDKLTIIRQILEGYRILWSFVFVWLQMFIKRKACAFFPIIFAWTSTEHRHWHLIIGRTVACKLFKAAVIEIVNQGKLDIPWLWSYPWGLPLHHGSFSSVNIQHTLLLLTRWPTLFVSFF